MKWLKRTLRNWLDDGGVPIYLNERPIRAADEPDTNCIRFKVFPASGGTVVQTEYYDRKTDRQHNSLYVIVDGKDIGQELGKIITIQGLKN